MPQGDAGGHFGASGGYGGNFGGAGGSSMGSSPGGPEHGGLGYGGMSPGGYNSTTYANNLAGINAGQPGFGARVAAFRAAQRRNAASMVSIGNGKGYGADPDTPIDPITGQPIPTPQPKPHQPDPWQDAYDFYGSPGISPQGPGYAPTGVGNWNNAGIPSPPSTGGNWAGAYGGYGSPGISPQGPGNAPQRQFGGSVEPGQQYTVGENGPETLQMRPGGGGQVIPHNPMDQMGGGFQGGMQQGGFQRPPQPSGFPQHMQQNPHIQQLRQWWQQRQQGQGGMLPGLPPQGRPQIGRGGQQRPFQIGGDLALRNFRGA